jgi:P-type Mg2+ transporter
MMVFGPVSSIFDFLTFFVMLGLLHAGHAEFRSGWFIESLATQTLVVFVIRTKRIPFFHSRPSLPMLVTPAMCALIGAVLPFTPPGWVPRLRHPARQLLLILLAMIATYLLLVEVAKRRFYAAQAHPRRPRATQQERRQRHIRRRAARFTHHATPRPPGRRRRPGPGSSNPPPAAD